MKPKRNQRTSAFKIAVKKRRNAVMRMRLQGATLRDIAAALPAWAEKEGIPLSSKYDFRSAYMDIDRELIKVDNDNEELKQHTLSLEMERLDYLQQGMWKDAIGGNEHKVDRVLKIMDRRAKFMGLDAQMRVELSGEMGLTVKDLHALLDGDGDGSKESEDSLIDNEVQK